MKNIQDNFTSVIDHPFIVDDLSHLRDEKTEIASFRRHSDQICQLLFTEAIRGLEMIDHPVVTPVGVETKTERLKDEVIVIPILRAGLAMLFGALQLLPKSKVGFVGLQRDEKTAVASEYYWKLPKISENSVVIVTDPMLATGGSLLHLLNKITPLKPKEIRIVCVMAAPEGIAAIRQEYPEVKIFTAAIDERLNEKKYIVPGLGDYGDRYFGTV